MIKPLEWPDDKELLEEVLVTLRIAVERLRSAEAALVEREKEIKVLRRAVKAGGQRFQALLIASEDIVVITTLKGIILEATKSATALLGVELSSLLMKPLVIFIAEGERKEFCARLDRLSPLLSRREIKFVMQPRGGDSFSASLRVGPIDLSGDHPNALQWVIKEM